ncbi:cephalosporin hydroxylase family protein [Mumia quercus]|uniref:cephalosporin hydroxylase family protein n=1 Tax=Mumia quercus TaxID=2976125 RepID=UPI0021CE4585|nr:cephalosporin hydroxylase family protein [Mumia quercus]
MSPSVKSFAVARVKPLLSDTAWAWLRDPLGRRGAPPPSSPAARLSDMDLTQLAQHFKTDKWGSHRYTPHYERHFAPWRDEAINVLEIGIGGYAREGRGGKSLRMWKHFFRHAQIVGLDIQDKSFVDAPRIRTYQGSQTDPEVLQRIIDETGELTIVIDDGSHRSDHIRDTFAYLFPRLAHGGIYAIEDTQTSYWPERGGSEDLDDPTTTMALVKSLVDGLHHEEFVDESYEPTYTDLHVVAVHCYHNLVIIEKGDNREGTRRRAILKSRYADG